MTARLRPAPAGTAVRYEVHDAIAAGGMATVHFGRLIGHAGFARVVAIKRLRPAFARDPDFVSMFIDEARVVSRVRHPNVIPILDVFAAEGELNLVMEYVDGETLNTLLGVARSSQRQVPIEVAAAVARDVLRGLHAAHVATTERGAPLNLVHRDVSPQNVIVGADGVARILDFGIAKAVDRWQTTELGQRKGKTPYMAPEQLRGAVSAVSDVYAASVVLWETLAARRLFVGKGHDEIVAAVEAHAVPPPSHFRADGRTDLDDIVLRGLAFEATERYESARAMALAIERRVGAALPHVVADWVGALAGEALGRRAETRSRVDRIPVAARAAPLEAGAAWKDVGVGNLAGVDTDATLAGKPVARATTPRSPRGATVRIGLNVALAASMLLFRGATPPPVRAAHELERSAAPLPGSIAPPPPPAVMVSATTIAPTSSTEQPTAAPRATNIAKVHADGAPPSHVAPPPASCVPPFSVDPSGKRLYKPGCL
ncbi:MAG: hypothetical protein NVSMB47_04130 [Polyangiales bacterium]